MPAHAKTAVKSCCEVLRLADALGLLHGPYRLSLRAHSLAMLLWWLRSWLKPRGEAEGQYLEAIFEHDGDAVWQEAGRLALRRDDALRAFVLAWLQILQVWLMWCRQSVVYRWMLRKIANAVLHDALVATAPPTEVATQAPIRVVRSDGYGAHLLQLYIVTGLEALKPSIAAHLNVHGDWRVLHLAAAAGRIDVVHYLVVELHISLLLKNRRGRNILHAALDHRRSRNSNSKNFMAGRADDLVGWLVHGEHPYAETDFRLDSLERAQLFTTDNPHHPTCGAPLLQAAANLDLETLRVLVLTSDNESRMTGFLPFSCQELVQQAIALLDPMPVRTFNGHQLADLSAKQKAWRFCWAFLLGKLREHDLLFGRVLDGDGRQAVAAVNAAPWGYTIQRSIRLNNWTSVERRALHQALRRAIENGQVEMVEWLLVRWKLSTHARQTDEALGDAALGKDVSSWVDKRLRASGPVTHGFKREYDNFLTAHILNDWNGDSSAELVEIIERVMERYKKYDAHELNAAKDQLRQWNRLARGCSLRDEYFYGRGEDLAVATPHLQQLPVLKVLLQVLGAAALPRLHVVLLSGCIWALKYMVEAGVLDLDAPVGGTRLEPEEEGGGCPICRDGFLAPVKLKCGHEFCRSCICGWMKKKQETAGMTETPLIGFCPYNCEGLDPPPSDLLADFARQLPEIAPWLKPREGASHADKFFGWEVDAETPVWVVVAAFAAHVGAVPMLELLADRPSVDLGYVYGDGSTLMHIAASARQPMVIKWLAAHGLAERMMCHRSKDGSLPLHCAARSCDLFTIEFLLQREGPNLYGSDNEGEGGWVDALLGSEHEAVQEIAREHLKRTRADRALAKVKSLLSEGGDLSEIKTAATGMQAALGCAEMFCHWEEGAEPGASDGWAGLLRSVIEHGRADVMRWLYSERCDEKPSLYDGYTVWCQRLAVAHARSEITAVFDELSLAQKAIRASRKFDGEMKEHVKSGGSVEDIQTLSDQAVAAIEHVSPDLLPDIFRKVGLQHYLSERSGKLSALSDFRVEETGSFTLANYVAVVGHLHLVEWILQRPETALDDVMRMLRLSVQHAATSQRSLEVQNLLFGWLQTNVPYVLEMARRPVPVMYIWAARFYDVYDDRIPAEGRDVKESSLFELAIHGLRISLTFGDPSDPFHSEKIKRSWATIDMLTSRIPLQAVLIDRESFARVALNVSKVVSRFTPLITGVRAARDVQYDHPIVDENLTRLLELFAKLGFEDALRAANFTSFGGETMPLERLLLKNYWLDALSWYVRDSANWGHFVNIEGLKLDFGPLSRDPKLEEWREEMSRKLAAIQAAQRRKREAVRARHNE